MQEGQGNIEQEIAELNRQINDKRAQLEHERGSAVENREAIQHVVGERMAMQAPSFNTQSPTKTQTTNQTNTSYLDALDQNDIEKINMLIDEIPKIGLNKVIERAKNEIPFILDAFHDALVDRLHSHLKSQNLI